MLIGALTTLIDNLNADGEVCIHISQDGKAYIEEDGNNVIVHANITGYGGSKLEPNVPTPDWSINQLGKLIESKFPLNKIVLRVDPIFNSDKGLDTSLKIMQQGIDMGISRIRFSFMDTHYKHLKRRFYDAGIKIPPSTPTQTQQDILYTFIAHNQKNHWLHSGAIKYIEGGIKPFQCHEWDMRILKSKSYAMQTLDFMGKKSSTV